MSILSEKERRRLFPIFKRYIYLNTASTGIIPEPSLAEMEKFLKRYRGESIHHDAETCKVMDILREKLGEILGASPENIALVFNTSFGINIAANGLSLKPGDKIVLPPDEFPANFYPWDVQRNRGAEIFITDGADEELFHVPGAKVVALSWVRFFDGFKFDIKKASEIAHKQSSYLCIDGIQGAGTLAANIEESGADTFSAGGQKWLLSPYGTGVFYIRKDTPIEPKFTGWLQRIALTGDYSSLRKYDLPLPDNATAFEAGTMPYHNLWAMLRSIEIIADIGIENIERHTTGLVESFIEQVSVLNVGIASEGGKRRSSIVAIEVPEPEIAFNALKEKRIICANREGKLRFSFHLYNNETDVERTIAALGKVMK